MDNLEFLPLRDVVFNTLRQEILTGNLKPGEHLREIALANKIGVSRTPVREAIRMLELEGLVKMIPRRGALVADISQKELRDVLEVRNALEQLAIELACERITKEQIDELKVNVAEFKRVTRTKDVTKLAQIDVEFHDIIFNATDNRRLIQMLNNLREQMYRFRFEYLKDSDVYEGLIEEHIQVIKNLEDRDVENARKNISYHIYRQVSTVSKKID
ncbi:MAG: GntR family transcriptional regulator [Lachnospiraceae bacterium]|nr:GntR family transcriptional regulator [Lachnospiraceae bacterium]